MSDHFGLELSRDSIRAVLVRRERVVWHACAPYPADATLVDTLDTLIAPAPVRRFGRARISVALGPLWARAKLLAGVPPVATARLATEIVRNHCDAFFIGGSQLVISDAHRDAAGATWCAGFDRAIIGDLQALADRRNLAELRALPVSACPTPPPARLAPLGSDALAYAHACAAATAPRRLPLSWRRPRDPARARFRIRLATIAAGALALSTATAAVAAPGIRASRFIAAAETELAHSRTIQVEVARVENELRRQSDILNRVHRLDEDRGAMTQLLAAIAQVVPESTAILSLHVDSLEGTIVSLSTNASEILPQLGSIDAIVQPRLVGAINRDGVAGLRLERATFRFRRRTSAPVPQPARTR